MYLEAFIAFLMLMYLRVTLKKSNTHTDWQSHLRKAMVVVGSLFGLQFIGPLQPFVIWIWHIGILVLIYYIFQLEVFQKARTVVFAVLPLVLLSVLSDLMRFFHGNFFDTIEGYLRFIYPFAIIWMIAMYIIFRRQDNALEKEKKKTLEEEKQNKIIAERKSELEVMVAERTAELTQQKEDLQHALNDLKITQAQLIHAEKMASLGELTAGIAHEIQNPLNFINNFSEVNIELSNELRQEVHAMNLSPDDKTNIEEILDDIIKNEQKINHHGKRADSIVKGMLQHSRKSDGQKEVVSINALADEYLRLSYHGLRAKDKSFNATIKTDFDESIGEISIIAQDMGRALLNLFNNAFYATTEKKKNLRINQMPYEPTVSVSTKKVNNSVVIKIRDNGTGIPQKVIDKIYQPFFTTKPTGEGTGLGLSLTYDIITKVHGGELQVNTRESEYTEFVITLPIRTDRSER